MHPGRIANVDLLSIGTFVSLGIRRLRCAHASRGCPRRTRAEAKRGSLAPLIFDRGIDQIRAPARARRGTRDAKLRELRRAQSSFPDGHDNSRPGVGPGGLRPGRRLIALLLRDHCSSRSRSATISPSIAGDLHQPEVDAGEQATNQNDDPAELTHSRPLRRGRDLRRPALGHK